MPPSPGLVPELRLPGSPQRGDPDLGAPEPRDPDRGRSGDGHRRHGSDTAHPVSDAPPAGVQSEDGADRHHPPAQPPATAGERSRMSRVEAEAGEDE